MGMKHVIQQLHYYFLRASGLPCKKEAQDFVNRKKLEEKPPKLNPPVCSKAEQQQENLTKCELLLCAVFFTSLPGMGPWRWPITGIFTTCCHCPGQGAHGHSGLWPSEACSAKLVSRWISPSSPLLPPRLQKACPLCHMTALHTHGHHSFWRGHPFFSRRNAPVPSTTFYLPWPLLVTLYWMLPVCHCPCN